MGVGIFLEKMIVLYSFEYFLTDDYENDTAHNALQTILSSPSGKKLADVKNETHCHS